MTSNREINLAPLDRLLHLSGAAGASALIAALLGDLQSTQTGLDLAWNGLDFAALRAHGHVLIALAGTIGDTYLQNLAQSLNTYADAQNLVHLMEMKPRVMTGLSDLIGTLCRLQISPGF